MTDPDDAPLLLEAHDLVAGYLPGVDILHGCSLTVHDREIVGVIGPNGAGKSTLVKAVFGLVPVRKGSVHLRGDDITVCPPHVLVQRGVGYVPQLRNVFAALTVDDNLRMGSYLDRRAFATRRAEIIALFPRLGERQGQRAGSLSGGERQMLAMGRALMGKPTLLMLDEPSLGLAPLIVREIFKIIADLRSSGVAILLVEQNARAALQVADYGYVLETGELAIEGRSAELAANPRVAATYLGKGVAAAAN
jgi:branched-chain amino acid transport system ATP-binding protein